MYRHTVQSHKNELSIHALEDDKHFGVFRRILSGLMYKRLYRAIHPTDPHFTPGAIRWLRRHLTNQMRVFEWGSGSSTSWYSIRVKEIVAIEHDEGWFRTVSATLASGNFSNAECRFVPESDPFGADQNRSTEYVESFGRPLTKPRFGKYVSAIKTFADDHFDVISVDGRERVGCIFLASSKLKEGGIIVLDDSNRSKYRLGWELLTGWRARTFSFGYLQTTIFQKPTSNLESRKFGVPFEPI